MSRCPLYDTSIKMKLRLKKANSDTKILVLLLVDHFSGGVHNNNTADYMKETKSGCKI